MGKGEGRGGPKVSPPRLTASLRWLLQMQQLELAQIRQREANLTALAAIGPRKKRKMDSPVQGASAEVKTGWRWRWRWGGTEMLSFSKN